MGFNRYVKGLWPCHVAKLYCKKITKLLMMRVFCSNLDEKESPKIKKSSTTNEAEFYLKCSDSLQKHPEINVQISGCVSLLLFLHYRGKQQRRTMK